jgi:Mn-dependent DtxR family transcriptional regulator
MHAERIDAVILRLLSEMPGPWQVAELERELGKLAPVRDSVARLAGAGLLHRIGDGFITISASGRYANSVTEQSV